MTTEMKQLILGIIAFLNMMSCTHSLNHNIIEHLLSVWSHFGNPVCVFSELREEFQIDLLSEFAKRWDVSLILASGFNSTLSDCATGIVFMETAVLQRMLAGINNIDVYSMKILLFIDTTPMTSMDYVTVYKLFAKYLHLSNSILLKSSFAYVYHYFRKELIVYDLLHCSFHEVLSKIPLVDTDGFAFNVDTISFFMGASVTRSKVPVVASVQEFTRRINASLMFVEPPNRSALIENMLVGIIHMIPHQSLARGKLTIIPSFDFNAGGYCLLLTSKILDEDWIHVLVAMYVLTLCFVLTFLVLIAKRIETFALRNCERFNHVEAIIRLWKQYLLLLDCFIETTLVEYFIAQHVYWWMLSRIEHPLRSLREFNESRTPICALEPSLVTSHFEKHQLHLTNPVIRINQTTNNFSKTCAILVHCDAGRYLVSSRKLDSENSYTYLLGDQLSFGDNGHTFHRSFPLVGTYHQFQMYIIQAGIWQHWEELFNAAWNRRAYPSVDSLDMDDVMMAWWLWLISLLVTVMIFLLEVLIGKIALVFRKCKSCEKVK